MCGDFGVVSQRWLCIVFTSMRLYIIFVINFILLYFLLMICDRGEVLEPFHIYIYGLFDDVVSFSDYVALSDILITEYRIGKDIEVVVT
jgi:hypothetical protein